MNASVMCNSVGFYQIAKLSMIPVSCYLEVILDNVRCSMDTKLSIVLVLLGVAVCTVTDVSVNAKGFIAAVIAVWSTALQQYQYYIHRLPTLLVFVALLLVLQLYCIQLHSLLCSRFTIKEQKKKVYLLGLRGAENWKSRKREGRRVVVWWCD